MRRFGVSRATVRGAIGKLEMMHLVRRRQGAGTFVNRRIDYVISPTHAPSLHKTVRDGGGHCQTVLIGHDRQRLSSGCTALPGAEESFDRLRAAGVKVALTTGFSRPTADAILDTLGWHDLVDLTLVPSEAGRGRPHPDLPLVALLRTGTSRVSALAVAGDTTSDVECGLRAGASIAAGVLTGAHDRDQLTAAGATHVFADVTAFADEVLSRQK